MLKIVSDGTHSLYANPDPYKTSTSLFSKIGTRYFINKIKLHLNIFMLTSLLPIIFMTKYVCWLRGSRHFSYFWIRIRITYAEPNQYFTYTYYDVVFTCHVQTALYCTRKLDTCGYCLKPRYF
jgi:hypothetical protein